MALLRTITCTVCGKEKTIAVTHTNFGRTVCNSCLASMEADNRQRYFDVLDTMSIHERVRAIEKWIYDYKPSTNLMFDKF